MKVRFEAVKVFFDPENCRSCCRFCAKRKVPHLTYKTLFRMNMCNRFSNPSDDLKKVFYTKSCLVFILQNLHLFVMEAPWGVAWS